MLTDPVALAQSLVRCESITPNEGGALTLAESWLKPLGFACQRLIFTEPGTPDVDNLFARLGTGSPHLCFAGHVDVVPPGDLKSWTYPPFAGVIANGYLHGRGSVDMKGNIAAFASAMAGHLDQRTTGRQIGSISLLLTADEEGPSVNGTAKVLQWMAKNGHTPTDCVVGEPTNPEALGDAIKVGRRGSLNARITVHGKQGHSAYPHQANNPVHGLSRAIAALLAEPLDQGTEHFDPSSLQVVAFDTGNPAFNVIPAKADAKLNIRYNDKHTAASLEAMVRDTVQAALCDPGLNADFAFHGNADAFVTAPGPLVTKMQTAIRRVTGRTPELSTSGGTSDARFAKNYCPVIESGLVSKTLHAIDERTPTADIVQLTAIYRAFLDDYFGDAATG